MRSPSRLALAGAALSLAACHVDPSSDVAACASELDGARPDGSYDDVVLADHPVAYWALSSGGAREADLTWNGNDGTYEGGTPRVARMPNGDLAADFDGAGEYLVVPSSPRFSIPTTGSLTWEAWIRPDVLRFPHAARGAVNWIGKCATYAPSCEWAARMYDDDVPERESRISAYAFNPSAGRGSGASWQPERGLLRAGRWYHVVAEYTTRTEPPGCPDASSYPGSIAIWVNGVPWSQAHHQPTGCMSQYGVVPVANESPLTIGTMAGDSWFAGAIGKVALYDDLLPPAEIARHYAAMTGRLPTGRCRDTCTF